MNYDFQALFIGLIIAFPGQEFSLYYHHLFSRIQEKHKTFLNFLWIEFYKVMD